MKAASERLICRKLMIDTFYLHLEFTGKNEWSINLPFLCTKCGNCCSLDDFLTAGKIDNLTEHPKVDAKVRLLFEELGKMWEADEAKYDEYTIHSPCPFLVNKFCSIYEIRPDGCRLFPKTTFGVQTKDCESLTRFKRMRATLKRGRATTETYYFTGKVSTSDKCDAPIKPVMFTEKQYRACVAKLRHAGMTDEELKMFDHFNGRNKSCFQ